MELVYEITNSQIKICSSEDYRLLGEITIPSRINNYPVVEICDAAFSDCKNLQKIIFPDTLKKIGKFAFFGCTSLKEIELPESVHIVDENAFRDCPLESIRLSDYVTVKANAIPNTCLRIRYKSSALMTWENRLEYVAEQMHINVSEEFKKAFEKLIADDKAPVFLTGAAGTGKTTLLTCLLHIFPDVYPNKKVLRCATTRIAAMLLNGRTVHSQFRFKSEYSPESGLLQGPNIYKIHNFYKSVKMLIIDEVSMLTPDLLDAIDRALRQLKQNPTERFGGVKVIFVGDLGQLPPVYKRDDPNLSRYEAEYGNQCPYFFDAHVLKESLEQPFRFTLSLKKVLRQQDTAFVNALDHLRSGQLTQEDEMLFNSCYHMENRKIPAIKRTTLFPKKEDVNKTNNDCLARLPGEKVSLLGKFTVLANQDKHPQLYAQARKIENGIKKDKGRYPFEVTLKQGARVMILKNNLTEGYCNGSIGIVDSFSINNNAQMNFINVKLLDSNRIVKVYRETESFSENLKGSQLNPSEEFTYATFEQFPLKLAWAITVHKSQGQTYSELFMDLREAFACGQVYTAFSRIKTLAGLRLLSPFTPDTVYVDERIRPFL